MRRVLLCLLALALCPSMGDAQTYSYTQYRTAQGRLCISQPNGAVARWHDGRLRSFPFGEDHATGAPDSDFAFAEDG